MKKSNADISNLFAEELQCLIHDLVYAREIVCKLNHDFVFNVVFNSANCSQWRLASMYGSFEKQLEEGKKTDKIIGRYKSLSDYMEQEYSLERAEQGYKNDFLRKLNKLLNLAQQLSHSLQ